MSPRGKRVTASQVGQYAYCAHAWWLGVVEGHEPSDLDVIERGTQAHERHGWRVSLARTFRKLALILLGIALAALLIWLLTWITTAVV
jgi:hypothetical protein